MDYLVVHKDLLQGDVQIFKKMEPLLLKGKVLDNANLLVVNLSSYNIKMPTCSINDLNIQPSKAKDDNFNISLALIITNPKDCFLISKYEGRYQSLEVDIDGVKKRVSFRLPIIIGPKEQVILSEINRELRID